MVNAKLDKLKVNQAFQRQPKSGWEANQPPKIGAMTGAKISNQRLDTSIGSRISLTGHIGPRNDRKDKCSLDGSKLVSHAGPIDPKRGAGEQTNKIPANDLPTKGGSQGRSEDEENIQEGCKEVRHIPPYRFRQRTGEQAASADTEQVHGCSQIFDGLAYAKFLARH
jgi:hypothetical protein